MPTILTHAVLPLMAGWASGGRIPKRLAAAGMIAAVLPDLDVIGMALGVPYGAPLGHRGASHSLVAALLLGIVAASAHRRLGSALLRVFWFVSLSAASHGLADMLTNGGRGIALWWPLSNARLFAPVRPVEVSAIGLNASFWPTLASEICWLLLPALVAALLYRAWWDRHIDLAKGQS